MGARDVLSGRSLGFAERSVATLRLRERKRPDIGARRRSAMTRLMKEIEELPEGFSQPTALPTSPREHEGWQRANRNWWETHPMRYDWKDEIPFREFSKEFYAEIDRRFFDAVALYAPCKEVPFDWLIDFDSLEDEGCAGNRRWEWQSCAASCDSCEVFLGNRSHRIRGEEYLSKTASFWYRRLGAEDGCRAHGLCRRKLRHDLDLGSDSSFCEY